MRSETGLQHFSTAIMVMAVITSTLLRFLSQHLRCSITMVENIKKQAFILIGINFPSMGRIG
ncbi:MAG: hypothetical protein JO033_24780 [Acidobacteriaceae bacterium]|nr:hypothetical protein [Acidobacteriaceae bacterium]MBV9498518.1 hypothetical protein [Acidobacteriaceae bacterium]